MKYLVFLLFVFSCSKNEEQTNCFNDRSETLNPEEKIPQTVKGILAHKPEYLQIVELKNFRTFKEDSIYEHDFRIQASEIQKYNKDFGIFDYKFERQFICFAKQEVEDTLYSLAKNDAGYWLLKIQNRIPYAYFLGLSFNQYYINIIQEKPIIQDGFLQMEGSFAEKIKKHYSSAIEDGKLFKIKLEDLIKDTDKDGYNDIFERSFGLNPNNKDSDGDGLNDLDDMNPLYKSEKNKFSELYQRALPVPFSERNYKKLYYTINFYNSDCNYFHQVDPYIRTIFVSEDKKKKTDYLFVTDVIKNKIIKITKSDKNPNLFYVYEETKSGTLSYCKEFKDGKWESINAGECL